MREAVPGQGHRPGPGRTPARSRLPGWAGHHSHLGQRPPDRSRAPGGLRRALPALDAGDAADRSPAVAVGRQGTQRRAVQGRQTAARRGLRAHHRHRRRSRRRDDRPRDDRLLRLPRPGPASVAVGAQRCVDPQGVRRTAGLQRDALPLPLRARAFPRRLAGRHQSDPPVHAARAPCRPRRRALRGARADAHPQTGRGPRPGDRGIRAGSVLVHRCVSFRGKCAVLRPLACAPHRNGRCGTLSAAVRRTPCGRRHPRRRHRAGRAHRDRARARRPAPSLRSEHVAGSLFTAPRPGGAGNPRHRASPLRDAQGDDVSPHRCGLPAREHARGGSHGHPKSGEDRPRAAAADRPPRLPPAFPGLERCEDHRAPRHHSHAGTCRYFCDVREGACGVPAHPRPLSRAVPSPSRVRPNRRALPMRRRDAAGGRQAHRRSGLAARILGTVAAARRGRWG